MTGHMHTRSKSLQRIKLLLHNIFIGGVFPFVADPEDACPVHIRL